MPTKQQLEKTVRKSTEGALRRAFLAAVDDLKAGVQIGRVIKALNANDIPAAIAACNLDTAAFQAFQRALEDGLYRGGSLYSQIIASQARSAGLTAVLRFGVRNLETERWLMAHSNNLVSGIVDDQKETLRQTLTAGMRSGLNPRAVALDIAGRMQGNKRVGGVLGLSEQHAEWLRSMAVKLRDPARMQEYGQSKLANQTYVKMIAKAAREGRALSAAQRRQILSRYSAKLLKLRADTIARDQMLTAMAAAKHESTKQALAKLGLANDAVTRTWDSAGDSRVRHTHRALDETVIVGMMRPFVTALGSRMMFPGDSTLGALAADTIQCRCVVRYRIDFTRVGR